MSGQGSDDDLARVFPPEGALGAACPQCRLPGQLSMEHRREWIDPPPGGWPPRVDAVRLAVACRKCGSDFLSVTTELVASAGAMAREMPWVVCEHCQHAEAARVWPWVRCGRCRAELRGRLDTSSRPLE